MDLDGLTRDVVCLPEQGKHTAPNDDLETGPNCYVAGWGRLSTFGKYPKKLQSINVNIFSKAYCIANSGYTNTDLQSGASFCAGHSDGSRDSCQGDSGGPLICVENRAPILYGIVSSGMDCGDADFPGIYSMVASQMDWLSGILPESGTTTIDEAGTTAADILDGTTADVTPGWLTGTTGSDVTTGPTDATTTTNTDGDDEGKDNYRECPISQNVDKCCYTTIVRRNCV